MTQSSENKNDQTNPHKGDADHLLARVLLVDDNEADIELNRTILIEEAKVRCELLIASDGKEALSILHAAAHEGRPIDLVLLDINMPVMSGYEMMGRMFSDKDLLQPLIIMCSTSSSDMDKRMAKTFGAAGYLVKPPQFHFLKDIIDECESLNLQQEGSDQILRRAA